MYERKDWVLFRNLESLCQKAGVSQEELPEVIAKELVDNALDESGNCNLNELEDGFVVEDNGDGMPPDLVESLFSFNRPLQSSKLLRLPTRGALGNGLRVVSGFVFATKSNLEVTSQGIHHLISINKNGEARSTQEKNGCTPGTKIKILLKGKNPHFLKARRAIKHAGTEPI